MSSKGDAAKLVVCFVCFSSAVALLIPLGEWDGCSGALFTVLFCLKGTVPSGLLRLLQLLVVVLHMMGKGVKRANTCRRKISITRPYCDNFYVA